MARVDEAEASDGWGIAGQAPKSELERDFPTLLACRELSLPIKGGKSPPLLRLGAEVGGLFQSAAKRKQRALVQRAADQLQAERQALGIEARRHAHARQARQVHRHRED